MNEIHDVRKMREIRCIPPSDRAEKYSIFLSWAVKIGMHRMHCRDARVHQIAHGDHIVAAFWTSRAVEVGRFSTLDFPSSAGPFSYRGPNMNLRSLWILSLAFCSVSLADEASHREAAARILEITKADKAMQGGFQAMIDPLVASMRQRGMPEAAAQEVKEAFNQWFTKEIKWEDIKPRMVDIYVGQFTESELKDLYAFYQSPTGQKTIEKLPVVMKQGAAIGGEYAQAKQQSLQLKLKEIAEKYAPKKGE